MTPPLYVRAEQTDAEEPIDTLVRALERRDDVSARERAALAAAVGDVRVHPPGDVLIRAGALTESSTLLLEGMLSRQFYLGEDKRQIVAAHVAGDFVDLHSLLLKRLDHDVVALSDVKVALFPHAALRRITEKEPHLARLLWLLTVIDAAVHREWTGRLGHSAAVRVAHLLCELQMRLTIVGGGSDQGFPLALTQADIGDMTGLTGIHVNRTLRKLRESGLVIVRAGYVSVPDVAHLRAFARFDPTYLYAERIPR
ncbi:Crp/Fnr family transcriptional regulator [Sphingomonas nostoxanthinifaciens]|uniref:Crp/Fnr family transcriptional regulator n=1 Tax=Sphingomonas nostoxanthinifaciens TaxID=2872652 RepID=UPI001CC201D3|nr:Crp/Fnr family transcriptional regulator [Sphingomonas nostoxanthinifaciens]UAK26350.1 Crp/Fnr family transcriptional regulator [Sphingomonas nostoxanthinifaciens]